MNSNYAVIATGVAVGLLVWTCRPKLDDSSRGPTPLRLRIFRMASIASAFGQYEVETGGTFSEEMNTRPPVSWRVALLPFVDHAREYREYDIKVPWNQQKQLAKRVNWFAPIIHTNPSDSVLTSVVAIVDRENGGEITAPEQQKRQRDNPADKSRHIVAVDLGLTDIEWMEPRDFSLVQLRQWCASRTTNRVVVLFSDTTVLNMTGAELQKVLSSAEKAL
ncbi:MAG: DUF1559 domain-containing protein [Planctomycetaceae bacterium]|nr:DUF1559 domain-containing protein [Planctomycetaceae bacterium]